MGLGKYVEQADGKTRGRRNSYHKFLKQAKARKERRRSRKNPECYPAYGKYFGYET